MQGLGFPSHTPALRRLCLEELHTDSTGPHSQVDRHDLQRDGDDGPHRSIVAGRADRLLW